MSAKARQLIYRRGTRHGWSKWILLANNGELYSALEVGLPTMPGCYELAIAEMGEQPHPVYVGRAGEHDRGLRTRVHHHATAVAGDERFCGKVLAVRKRGLQMFVSYRKTSLRAAKPLEDQCLREWWRYHWNTVKMPWGRA